MGNNKVILLNHLGKVLRVVFVDEGDDFESRGLLLGYFFCFG